VIVADHLRANGITITPDHKFFADRRRVKNEAEIAGIRKAQKAAEAGMAAAKEILARAEQSNGSLTVDGEPLTSELIKGAIRRAFTEHGVASDDFIVSHGAQTAIGHELGSGEIAANEPIVIDLWPKDPDSACYADMTRTYVVGTPPEELVTYYDLVKEALDRSLEATKPGVLGVDVFKLVCEHFEENGQPTVLSKTPGEVLEDGFFHGLGHGVGLEVHEAPNLGRGGTQELMPGDVVTLEPGLYRQGFGGCRLEDLVLVTEDGAENLTDFPYDLTP
jgi:Xaa-Pro aminopeptidase